MYLYSKSQNKSTATDSDAGEQHNKNTLKNVLDHIQAGGSLIFNGNFKMTRVKSLNGTMDRFRVERIPRGDVCLADDGRADPVRNESIKSNTKEEITINIKPSTSSTDDIIRLDLKNKDRRPSYEYQEDTLNVFVQIWSNIDGFPTSPGGKRVA